jgi:Virulence factor
VPDLTVILWRDIPAQVASGSGRRATRAPLSERFQEAIDAAAMAAGLAGTDAYLEEWRRETVERDGDAEECVAAEAARIEREYTDDVLARLIRARGLKGDDST